MNDPAVRSLRVALALCERFAELLKGPSSVTARKQSGALFGVSGNDEGLSMRIGEVQQLYPEIWRHLDDARDAFAARGTDVSAFDQIRATEGIALGAAVDVKHARHGYGQYAVDETVKSANFNQAGHARAVKAADALMRATPGIDWAAIARAEAEDPAVAAFTRSTSTKRWIRIGLLVALFAAPFAYVGRTCMKKEAKIEANRAAYQEARKLSAPERAALDQAIAGARAKFAAARQAWPAAVAPDALAAAVPTANPCPYKFVAPTAEAAARFVRYGSVDGRYFGTAEFPSYGATDPIRDRELVAAASTIEGIAIPAGRGQGGRHDRDRLASLPEHLVFLVIDREVEPVPGTGTVYTPGEVVGRAYVFSVTERRIVCAGAVDVRNPPDVVTSPRDDEAKATLFRDLEVRIRNALATGLHAI